MVQRTEHQVKVDGKTLILTNLEKVLYKRTGFTKADIIDYYSRISAVMLPHLRRRMLTLKRYPEGTEGFFFYEKRCPAYRPSWLKTKLVKSTHGKQDIPYCEIDSKAGLIWMANLACIEFHILLSDTSDVNSPTSMVFDLDPGPGRVFSDCCALGLKMRAFFKVLNLEVFPKSSGKKGLHLYVPFNSGENFDHTKDFAHQTALALQRKYPAEVTAEMKKVKRKNLIFIDWSQNDSHKTTVCAYSLRAADRPSVSTPLTWTEVEAYSRSKKDPILDWSPDKVLKRVKTHGDLFKEVLTLKQKLPKT